MMKKVPGTFSWLGVLALACAACGGEGEEVPPPPIVLATLEEPAACATCHAAETARWQVSAHRLAARPFADTLQPPHAMLSDDTILAPDASGATEARSITHVLGGRRREDFLSPRPDGPHVLPLSWSVTRSAWVDPTAEEHGAAIDPKGPLGWTKTLRSHQNSCARCHPVTETTPGITCSTCHADALEHARAASTGSSRPTQAVATSDPWNGCGACHAVGLDMPRVTDARASDPLLDVLLPDTLVLGEGFNPSFFLDGRPRVPHGREAQSLAQSACFRKGGANCLTCHDPHGGERTSLNEADPDASCKGCHASVAADAAKHARHPVATSVPLAIDEPAGPWKAAGSPRLPGCVDCHAPATLGFSPEDAVRDHAIGVPDPSTARKLGIADACSACHAGWSEKRLASALPPRGSRNQGARAKTFATAARALFGRGGSSQEREALEGAVIILADADLDPWTRASAATLLGMLGRTGSGATPERSDLALALETAWASSTDPVLRRAIAGAHPLVGGTSEALAGLMASETDWRVRLACAAALASRRDPRGEAELDSLHRDMTLPGNARADAAFELASILLTSGSRTRSEALLLESLATSPNNTAAWVNLGTLRANSGNTSGAREAWQQALELSPSNPIPRANLAALAEAEAAASETTRP